VHTGVISRPGIPYDTEDPAVIAFTLTLPLRSTFSPSSFLPSLVPLERESASARARKREGGRKGGREGERETLRERVSEKERKKGDRLSKIGFHIT
jgi:hypothetical protein